MGQPDRMKIAFKTKSLKYNWNKKTPFWTPAIDSQKFLPVSSSFFKSFIFLFLSRKYLFLVDYHKNGLVYRKQSAW